MKQTRNYKDNIWLPQYVLKVGCSRPGASDSISCILLIKCVSKAEESRPPAAKTIFEYIPHWICLESLDQELHWGNYTYSWLDTASKLIAKDQGLQRCYMSIFCSRYLLKAWGSTPESPRRILHILLIRNVLKAYGNWSGATKRTCEYIADIICLRSLI